MSDSSSLDTELSREETKAIWRSIEERVRSLDRCRAVFDVQISDAYRALPYANPDMPERCRIVYQRAGEQVWQVTAFDEFGSMLSDSVCDGLWIEAGGKCWDRRYMPSFQSISEYEPDALSDEDEDIIEAKRDTLSSELSSLLWPLNLATEHLLDSLNTLTVPFMRESWHFSRNPESGCLTCRSRYNYEPAQFCFSTWEYIRWRFARLFRSNLDIVEYFGRVSVPLTEVEFTLNESCGYIPEQLRATDRFQIAIENCRLETWEDPISFDDGLKVPRVHRILCSSTDGEKLRHSTLVPEESSFGVNIPLNIRSVDRSLDLVEW